MKHSALSLAVITALASCRNLSRPNNSISSCELAAYAPTSEVTSIPAATTVSFVGASSALTVASASGESDDLVDLASRLSQESKGMAIGGWLRSRYANSSDVDTDPAAAGTQDLGGFSLDSLRLNFSGSTAAGYSLDLSLEGGHQGLLDTGNNGLTVLDAYATVPLGDQAQVVIGRFASNFLWSTNVEERKQLFLDRTFAGENADNRDTGFELSGSIDRFNWWAALQNGSDGAGNENAVSGRASYRLIGAPCSLQEGCCEPTGDVTHLILGVAGFDDTNLDDGTAVAADLWFLHAPFSAYAEIVDWGDDIRPLPGVDHLTGTIVPSATGAAGSGTSTSLTVGYVLSPQRWELGARFQDLDDIEHTRITSAAIDRYLSQHNAKWTLQLDHSDSDFDALEVDVLALGLTVGI